ncbi:gametocyte-specific factor 1-like isoform X2 [Rhopalosiphum padi]|uniref:gametocyte-specific factor 1-like isoform X2 n=1 Tax=Rhopalosiphum padi TaxID=40932 RepID=UPI00298ECC7A|nr:gametocyte-specific factor 1-like isoform X2 [Rhopalosiphum padi]
MESGKPVCCPFNPGHRMPQKTLLLHLTRCPDKKNNQAICPFNNFHIVDSAFVKEHIRQCRDRPKFEEPTINVRVNKFEYDECPDSIETTWDDEDLYELPVQGVSGNTVANQTGYFTKPQSGLSKAQRKKNCKEQKFDRQNSSSNAGK